MTGHPVRGWRRGNQGDGNADEYTECPGDDRLVAVRLDPGRVRRNQLHVDLKPDTEEESKEHRNSGTWAINPSPDDTKQENGGKRRGKKGIKCLYIDEETPSKPAYHPPEADGNYENNHGHSNSHFHQMLIRCRRVNYPLIDVECQYGGGRVEHRIDR